MTGNLRGGAAVRVITPSLGTLLMGGFRPRTSTSVESDLTVRALVLDNGEARVALVVCDLTTLPGDLVESARAEIQSRCGIPPSAVMISATHTHSGPYVADRVGVARDEAFVRMAASQVAEAVAVAASRLTPVTVAVGTAQVAGVCFNRRYTMSDGTVVTNPGLHNEEVVGPAGPVDPTVTAMLVESLEGEPVALWTNLSLHYVGTSSSQSISADYFGRFARIAERWLGGRPVAMLSNGASGDINNIDLAETVPNHGAARAEQVATAVAAAAISAVMTVARKSDIKLSGELLDLVVDRCPVTDGDLELANDLLADEDRMEERPARFSFVTGGDIYPRAVERYAKGVPILHQMPATGQTQMILVHVGDLVLVGLPGEIFVEFGLQIKAASPTPFTAVVGLCGGSVGYIPTERAFDEGSYETWRHPGSWTARGTGERMVECVNKRLTSGSAQTV